MPEFSLNELAEDAGSGLVNMGKSLATRSRDFACGLYRDYPGWATIGTVPNSPAGAFLKGTWDTICATSNVALPDPNTPPPTGGNKCFQITFRNMVNTSGVGYACHESYQVVQKPNGLFYAIINGVSAEGSTTCYELSAVHIPWSSGQVAPSSQYGSCSSCWAYSPPIIEYPPTTRLTEEITIINNDGTDINVPLTWNEIDNENNLNIDVGGVEFKLNVDGVKFDFSRNTTTNQETNNINNKLTTIEGDIENLNTTITNLGDTNNSINTTINTIGDTITNISTVLDEVKGNQCECPEEKKAPTPDKFDKTVMPKLNSDIVDGITDLSYLEVHVYNFENLSKIQSGHDSPNVLYCGWMSWRVDGNNYDRQPLHFEHNVFIAPPQATGYSYCCTYSSRAIAIYYTKIQE